jgi:hypothetical protein
MCPPTEFLSVGEEQLNGDGGSPVDVAAVAKSYNHDYEALLLHGVENPVVPHSDAMQPLYALQFLASRRVGILREGQNTPVNLP